jgi:uncharacterized protein (DUF4415 family)
MTSAGCGGIARGAFQLLAGMKPSRRGRLKLEAPKVEVKIRLDVNTVEHLRGSRPGWQTRVDAVLEQLAANGQI